MNKQTRVMPTRLHRAGEASIAQSGDDPNLITLTWTTGFKGLRSDALGSYYEELDVSPQSCDLSRLNKSAPLLANHDSSDLECVLGVVERAWFEGQTGKAEVRLSARTDIAGITGDIRAGIMRNVSVGYQISQMTDVSGAKDKVPTLRATRWQPFEISIVPVGFDPFAQTERSGGETLEVEILKQEEETQPTQTEGMRTMSEKDEAATEAVATEAIEAPLVETPAPVEGEERSGGATAMAVSTSKSDDEEETDEEKAKRLEQEKADAAKRSFEAVQADRKRALEISKAVSAAGLSNDFAHDLIERGIETNEATKLIFAEAEKNQIKTGGVDRAKESQMTVNKRALVEAALSHRMNKSNELPAEAMEFRGQSFLRAFEAILPREVGEETPSYAARVMQTSDMPALLANVANKQLRIAYDALTPSYTQWAASGTTPDFKTAKLINISVFPPMQSVAEGAAYPASANVLDTAESMTLSSYGQVLSFTRQMLINDDLSALSSFASKAAASAMRNVDAIAYSKLTANAAMADTIALFHASHNNLAGTASAISVASLTAGKVAMARQTDPSGALLNIKPKFLIVPPELETTAKQLINSTIVPNTVSSANPFAGTLQVVVSPQLTGTAWYLAADPTEIDTVKVFFLQGQEAPSIETRIYFETGATQIKVTHDVGAAVMDYRGLYKNAGV